MTNKTELFIQIPTNEVNSFRFGDTYLAPSIYGNVLGLEFQEDITSFLSVGDDIYIDKDDKSLNPWINGTTTIIGITSSFIFPAPGTLVFTNILQQSPVFTNNESGTMYLGTGITSGWEKVDLSDNVPFPLTFNIADVREINNRNGSYSKTIQIPGTKNNNDVFKYIFDIQSINNYDTRIKVKANITVDTIPVLEGYIQLNSIQCTDNDYWVYECVVYGENANFSKELQDNKIENLDFSEFNHTFTLNAVTASWTADWNNGYHYSMIDYNYNFSINDPLISLPLNFFRPNLYAKVIWDKIFNTTSFTYESEFLNSDLFKSLIITTNQQKQLNTQEFRLNNTYRVGLTQSNSEMYAVIAYDPSSQQPDAADNISTPVIIPFADDTTSPNGDPGNVFNTSTYKYTNSSIYKKQKFGLNVDFKVVPYYMDIFGAMQPVDITNATNIAFLNTKQLRIDILLYRSKNPQTGVNSDTLVSTYTIYNAGDDPSVFYSYGNVNFSPTQIMDTDIKRRYETPFFEQGAGNVFNALYSGENLFYKIKVFTYGGDDNVVPVGGGPLYWEVILNEPQDGLDDTEGTYIFNYVDSDIQIGQELDINSSVPLNIKQVDFMTSIIKMFNLYIMPDKVDPKKLIIEPRDDFYYESEYLDWSNKLDLNKDIIQDPIVDEKLRITLTHKSDGDFYNKDYTNRTNRVYGDRQFVTGNEFNNNEIKVETIFSPTVLTPIRLTDGGISTSIVLPKIWSKETIEDSDKNKVTGNIRILQRSESPISTNGINYQIQGINFNVYPFVGNINDPLNPSYDINFDNPLVLYYSGLTPTTNNLWNLFYERYAEEIYGKESKLITCYLYLTPQDIIDFDYRKQIYLSNMSSGSPGYYRINKIEYDPFNKQSYKVELIKILNNRKSPYRRIINIGDVGVTLPPNSGVTVVSPGNGNQWTSDLGVIIGRNNFTRSDSFNIVGESNIIEAQSNNTLLSGKNNIIGDGSSNSFIIGGVENSIDSNARNGGIIGGSGNRIAYNPTGDPASFDTDNNIIIGGINNYINQGVTGAIIINGDNFTATQSDTIYLQGNVLINGATMSPTPAIPANEIVFGDGTGITSSPDHIITSQGSLIAANFGLTDSSTFWSVGLANELSTIAGQANGMIANANGSFISPDITQSFMAASNGCTISATISGVRNTILASASSQINGNTNSRSAIIGGNNNTITGANGSAIIGGSSLSLTQSNTVLVPNLIVNDDLFVNGEIYGDSLLIGATSISNNTISLNEEYVYMGLTAVGTNYIRSNGQYFGIQTKNPGSGTHGTVQFYVFDDGVSGYDGGVFVGGKFTQFVKATPGSTNTRGFVTYGGAGGTDGGTYEFIFRNDQTVFKAESVSSDVFLRLSATASHVKVETDLIAEETLTLTNTSGTVTFNSPTFTTTVNNTRVTANSIIILTAQSVIDTGEVMYISNIVPGTSFDITFVPVLTSTVDIGWMMIN